MASQSLKLLRAAHPADVALALALAAFAVNDIWFEPLVDPGVPGPRGANTALLLLATLPLAWRRRAPIAVFAIVIGAIAAHIGLTDPGDQPPAQDWLAALVAFYSIGAHGGPSRALLAAASGGTVIVVLDLVRVAEGRLAIADQIFGWLLFAAAWVLGRALHRRQRQVAALTDRTAQLERERAEQARRAVAEERARIARELHDIISHSISVVTLQTQAVRHRLAPEQKRERDDLRAVETTARQAMAEMRRLFGVLRAQGEPPSLAPQPGLAELERLIEHTRAAGVPTELLVEGEPVALPPGVDLAAYRIVQEALSNTRRHAGPARATVAIRYGERQLELEIRDNGAGRNGDLGVGGYGLVGMAERVRLYGGTLETDNRPAGGFRVQARLPFREAAST